MILDAAQNWSELAAELPVNGVLIGGFILVVGMLLWLFGRRILKPAFVLAGAVAGAATGAMVGMLIALPLPQWIPPLAGAALFGVLAWAAFRPGMAICMAIVCGLASPLLVFAWAELRDIDIHGGARTAAFGDDADHVSGNQDPLDLRRFREELDELERRMRDADDLWGEGREYVTDRGRELLLGDDRAEAADETGERVSDESWTEQLDRVVADIRAEIARQWESLRPEVRRSVLLSAAAGAVFGLLLGLIAPFASASIITAMVGSGMMLSGGHTFVASLTGEAPGWLPTSALNWVIIWTGATIAGIGFQWMIRARPADKAR